MVQEIGVVGPDADVDAVDVRLHAERRKVLFKRGDPCEGFHMLVSGKVKLSLVSSQGIDKPRSRR